MTIALTKALASAAEHALAEALAGQKIYPNNEHMHAALGEEVGEVANALLEAHRDPTNEAKQAKVYAEAMQVAAMAIRIAVEGSAEFSYQFKQDYADAFKPVEPPPAKKPNSPKPKKTVTDRDVEQQKAIDRLIDEMRQINKRKDDNPYDYPTWIGVGVGGAPRAMWSGGAGIASQGFGGGNVSGGSGRAASGGVAYCGGAGGGGATYSASRGVEYTDAAPIKSPPGLHLEIKLPAEPLRTDKDAADALGVLSGIFSSIPGYEEACEL